MLCAAIRSVVDVAGIIRLCWTELIGQKGRKLHGNECLLLGSTASRYNVLQLAIVIECGRLTVLQLKEVGREKRAQTNSISPVDFRGLI